MEDVSCDNALFLPGLSTGYTSEAHLRRKSMFHVQGCTGKRDSSGARKKEKTKSLSLPLGHLFKISARTVSTLASLRPMSPASFSTCASVMIMKPSMSRITLRPSTLASPVGHKQAFTAQRSPRRLHGEFRREQSGSLTRIDSPDGPASKLRHAGGSGEAATDVIVHS